MDTKLRQKIEDLQNEILAAFPGAKVQVQIMELDHRNVPSDLMENVPSPRKEVKGNTVVQQVYGFTQYEPNKQIWISCKPVQVANMVEVPITESPIS